MPHGIVGLLIAVILCATMSATAATLNALGSTTAIDFYRPLIRPNASDHHYVVAAKALTAAWGLIAIGVASFASLVENLIEAGNILGSVFLWQHSRSFSGSFLYSSSYRLGSVFRGAPCASARLRSVRDDEYRLPLV